MGSVHPLQGGKKEFTGHLRVRRAKTADFETLRRWTGQDRSPSLRSTGRIFASESRREAYEKILADGAFHLLVLETWESGKWVAAGAVITNPSGEIHLVLDPDFRGRGLSVPAIRSALEYLHSYPLFELTAFIGRDDVVSRKAFEKTGFIRRKEKNLGGIACLEYSREMKSRCPVYNVFI